MTLRSIGALKICAFMPSMFYKARQLASGARIDELALNIPFLKSSTRNFVYYAYCRLYNGKDHATYISN
jgi:hypothetical protein